MDVIGAAPLHVVRCDEPPGFRLEGEGDRLHVPLGSDDDRRLTKAFEERMDLFTRCRGYQGTATLRARLESEDRRQHVIYEVSWDVVEADGDERYAMERRARRPT